MSDGIEIIGYDVPAVEKWISENTEGLAPPFRWTRLEGGHSNLTYGLEDSLGNKAVVRRPPMGELLPKAHDMGREFAIISGLGPTEVPVPTPVKAERSKPEGFADFLRRCQLEKDLSLIHI